MKVYLAAPMSGIPEGNFPAIRDATHFLRDTKRFTVVSPVEMNERDGRVDVAEAGDPQRHDFMRRDLLAVLDPTLDAVVVLPGWERSEGVKAEISAARAVGLAVLAYPSLTPLFPRNESVLQEAERIVSGARSESYGHPADHTATVADLWRSAFGWDVDPFRVNLAMILFKLARADVGRARDSLVDMAGYGRTAEAVLAREGVKGFRDLK